MDSICVVFTKFAGSPDEATRALKESEDRYEGQSYVFAQDSTKISDTSSLQEWLINDVLPGLNIHTLR